MTLQTWHTCIWGVSFFSPDPLKLCQVGWGASLHSYFQVCPEMFDQVQVRALAGPLKDIQRLAPKPLMCCLGCVLRVVVLLEGSPSNRTATLSTQPRQCRSGFGTSLWMYLSGPARARTWTRSNIAVQRRFSNLTALETICREEACSVIPKSTQGCNRCQRWVKGLNTYVNVIFKFLPFYIS